LEGSLYIYAFCDRPAEGLALEGLNGAPVRFVEAGGVFAAVSDAPAGRLRPQRRLLAAHQGVLAAIAGEVSTLPAAFGLIADSEDMLIDAVTQNASTLAGELERVAGCVEMEVRLGWDVPSVFEHLVEIDETLRAMRDRLVALGDGAPHDLRVEIGRRVERVLEANRNASAHAVIEGVEDACREIDRLDPASESELVRLTALVAKDSIPAFEAAIQRIAESFDDTHAFRLSGPFAPHSFVDLHLDLSSSRLIA
jgi:hypothetical protein